MCSGHRRGRWLFGSRLRCRLGWRCGRRLRSLLSRCRWRLYRWCNWLLLRLSRLLLLGWLVGCRCRGGRGGLRCRLGRYLLLLR